MKTKIKLSQGYEATVDEADAHWLREWKWSASDCSRPWHNVKKIYAVRASRKDGVYKKMYMHREIMRQILIADGLDPDVEMKGRVVDHQDGDGLNNTRENLWLIDHADNSRHAISHAHMANEMGDTVSKASKRAYKAAIKKRKAQRQEKRHRRTEKQIAKALKHGKAEKT